MKTVLTIPTYNAGELFDDVISAIKMQSVQPDKIIVIDSNSSDNSYQKALEAGFECMKVEQSDFNHGLTRMITVEKYSDYDIAIYLTQDAVMVDKDALKHLLQAYSDENVAVAYGRQLTKDTSSLIEKSLRAFNYPAQSIVKQLSDKDTLGLNTPFNSNSFSSYRINDMLSVGGFGNINFAEDMIIAAKLLMQGKSVAYVAEAQVFHTHEYSIMSEYKRGIEIGKIHKNNKWLLDTFGSAEKRGLKVLSNASLAKKLMILLQALPKFMGYRVGKYF